MWRVCSVWLRLSGSCGDAAGNRCSRAFNTRQRSWAPSRDSEQGGGLEASCLLVETFPEKRLLFRPIMRS